MIQDSKTDVFLPEFTCLIKIDLSLIIFLRVINGPINDPRLQDACILIFTWIHLSIQNWSKINSYM